MNLQPKILSNAFLINGYTPAVDMILVILCILLLLLLRETFIRRSRLFLLFRTCIALLLIAAFSNSCFYYTVLYFDSDTTLCILRAIYHSSLLLIFCLYAAYLKILIGIPGKILYSISRAVTEMNFPIFLIYHFCHCGCTVTCIGLQFLPRQLRCMA